MIINEIEINNNNINKMVKNVLNLLNVFLIFGCMNIVIELFFVLKLILIVLFVILLKNLVMNNVNGLFLIL